MAFIDDFRTARAELAAAHARHAAELDRMADGLFTRTRQWPALASLTDPALRHCCRAFALAADEQDAAGSAAPVAGASTSTATPAGTVTPVDTAPTG